MKKLFLSATAIILLQCFSAGVRAQAAGNAVGSETSSAGNLRYNNIYGSNNGAVDLSIRTYGSSFSNLLEANVMINVKASSYVAMFSLTQYGKTTEEAESAMTSRMEIFKAGLQKEGMGADQIFFDPITMVPTYETEVTEKKLSRTFNEVPTGFEIKRNVHITFSKQEQINDIIAIAAKAEVYDMVKVEYNIDNKDALLNNLRNEALRILQEKKIVLEKAGIYTKFTQVGEMQSSAYPFERYAQYYAYKAGASPAFINNSKKGQAIQVQYNYAEKNKTLFYDKVSDKQFDKIINPVVNEPMVQVYFSLKGQYEIIDPQQIEKDKAYNEKLKEYQLKSMELDLEAKRKDIQLKGKPVTVVRTSNKKQGTNEE